MVRAAIPAVGGPGTADQAADDHDQAGQCEPERHTAPPRRSVHQRSLPKAFNQAGTLHYPLAANLDRGRTLHAWRSGRPSHAGPAPPGRTGSHTRRPGARSAGWAAGGQWAPQAAGVDQVGDRGPPPGGGMPPAGRRWQQRLDQCPLGVGGVRGVASLALTGRGGGGSGRDRAHIVGRLLVDSWVDHPRRSRQFPVESDTGQATPRASVRTSLLTRKRPPGDDAWQGHGMMLRTVG
jgi:hypothetical protein